jgi:superfamily II DNA or RNA helicase
MSSILKNIDKKDVYTLNIIYTENDKKVYIACLNSTGNDVRVPFYFGKEKKDSKEEKKINIILDNQKVINKKFIGSLTYEQSCLFPLAMKCLTNYRCCFLSLYCGAGKTIFSIYLASLLDEAKDNKVKGNKAKDNKKIFKKKILIQNTRIQILDQWKYALGKHLPSLKVCQISSKTFGDNEEKNNKKFKEYDIFLVNPTVIRDNDSKEKKKTTKKSKSDSEEKSGKDDKINKGLDWYYKLFKGKISTLILDEFHLLNTQKKIDALMCFAPDYLIGLSATPYHDDSRDHILPLFFGPNIIIKKLYRPFNVYLLESDFDIPNPKKTYQGKIDWNNVLELQTTDVKRNKMIIKLIQDFSFRNILVLCKRVNQTKYLYDVLSSSGEDVDTYTGTDKEYKKDCRVLISTYSKVGVGFDSDRLDALIIASDVVEGIEQYVGRIFSRSKITPIIFDIKDKFGVLRRHMNERIDYYKSCGGEIKMYGRYFGNIV